MAENVTNNVNEKILKILLYGFALYHGILGLVAIFFTNFAFAKDIALAIFNFNLTLDSQMQWLLKPLGAYVLVVGIVAYLATLDLSKYKPIIYALVCVIILRIFERIWFIWQGGGLIAGSATQSIVGVIFVAIYGTAIFYFARKI